MNASHVSVNNSSAKRKLDENETATPNKIARLDDDDHTPVHDVITKSKQQAQASPWTYAQCRPILPRAGRRISEAIDGDMVAFVRSYGTATPAMVDQQWLPHLEEGKWLSSNEVSFYCYEVGNAYAEGAPGRGMDLVVFHSDTWGLGTPGHNGPGSIRHKSAPCPLEYKYIAFPANESENHFFLCLILWPSDLLVDVNPAGPVRTTAIILNSLASLQPTEPHGKIQRIIGHLSLGRSIRQLELRNLNVRSPRVSGRFCCAACH